MHKGARTDPCGGREVTRAPTATKAAKRDREVEQVAHGQKLAEINGEVNEVSYTEIVE